MIRMSLEEYITYHRRDRERSETFVVYLNELMNKHGIEKASSVYLKANITKQAWSNIISNKSTPTVNTCIKIALAMKLSNHECKYLLKKAGFTLGPSSDFALIIRYCIENKIYDICDVTELLNKYGYTGLD